MTKHTRGRWTVGQSFSQGWHDAAFGIECDTPRQTLERYPDIDVDAYLNGMEDGVVGDRFRLDGDTHA